MSWRVVGKYDGRVAVELDASSGKVIVGCSYDSYQAAEFTGVDDLRAFARWLLTILPDDGAPAAEDVFRGLLADHSTDWGFCDQLETCVCSHARARRALAAAAPSLGRDPGPRVARCPHTDGVGAQCLRPVGHPAVLDGWFVANMNDGHDFGGVCADALTRAQWAAL